MGVSGVLAVALTTDIVIQQSRNTHWRQVHCKSLFRKLLLFKVKGMLPCSIQLGLYSVSISSEFQLTHF